MTLANESARRRAQALPWLLLAALTACGDKGSAGGQVTPSAAPAPVASAPAASSAAATTAASSASPSASASAAPSAAPERAVLGKPRSLRTGEQAAVERAFAATARLDFAQSFVVDLGEGLGRCMFVSQLVEEVGTGKPAPSAASATVPSAAPSVSAAPAPSASAAPAGDVVPKPLPVSEFRFHLLCKGKEKVTLPSHPGVEESWTGHGVKAVTFPDTDEDGLREIVIVTEMMTGIGPEGAKPFPVVFVYRFADGAYGLDAKTSKKATDDGLGTLADVKELMQ